MIIYISGPISGHRIEDVANLFERAQNILTLRGHQVVNPLVISSHCASWREAIQNDLKALMECDAIYLLAGWRTSKGAFLEYQVAMSLGLQILYQDTQDIIIIVDMLSDAIKQITGLDLNNLKSSSRKEKFVKARHLFCKLLSEGTHMTLSQIGNIIGRNYGTVLHSIRTANNLNDFDKNFRAIYISVKELFYTTLKQYEEICNERG